MPKFIVTSAAGPVVAGVSNPGAGKEILLTESQAKHPLRLGHVARPMIEAPKPSRRRRKKNAGG
jgi:hypothetical protein